jgi:solute carrier family 13 (sodium-dependent dicarboxylate transporter), member 2/3/5
MTLGKNHINIRLIFIGFSILGFFLVPALPILDGLPNDAKNTIACAALMVILWLSEAIPIPVTALLPIVLFPALGINPINDVTQSYGNPIVFLFFGGFTLALALEKWDLHKRIALNIIRYSGKGPNGILAGFMMSTAFLSMWISNTATAVIMLPIAISVIDLCKRDQIDGYKNFGVAMMLVIAYSANIGGMATLIGTPPNVVLKGLLESNYQIELTFSSWLMLGLPLSMGMLAATYFVIAHWLYPTKEKVSIASEIIKNQLSALGPVSGPEKKLAFVFLLTVLCWTFRLPINHLLDRDLLSDTNIAIGSALLLFVIPAKDQSFLMDWKTTQKLPWGILLLFGGGLALAAAMEKTGIVHLIGQQVSAYSGLNIIVLVLILSAIMLFMTELMSNVALCTVFVPMTFGIAEGFQASPLMLAIPVTLASSCAFMLPMGTPPNAIVFAGGYLRIKDMVRAGIFLNIIATLAIVGLCYFLVPILF